MQVDNVLLQMLDRSDEFLQDNITITNTFNLMRGYLLQSFCMVLVLQLIGTRFHFFTDHTFVIVALNCCPL